MGSNYNITAAKPASLGSRLQELLSFTTTRPQILPITILIFLSGQQRCIEELRLFIIKNTYPARKPASNLIIFWDCLDDS